MPPRAADRNPNLARRRRSGKGDRESGKNESRPMGGRHSGENWRARLDKTANWEIIIKIEDVKTKVRRRQSLPKQRLRPEKRAAQEAAPSSPMSMRSVYRELAEELVRETIPDGRGGRRVRTRAEIEAELIRRLGVSRTVALSASTKAVRRLDPENPARSSRRKPVARRIGENLKREFRRLRDNGMTQKQIADLIGADVRTVRNHLKDDAEFGPFPTRRRARNS